MDDGRVVGQVIFEQKVITFEKSNNFLTIKLENMVLSDQLRDVVIDGNREMLYRRVKSIGAESKEILVVPH